VEPAASEPSLLAGLIFDDGGERMTPTHANKKGRRYRYYVTHSLIKRGRPKASDAARRVPAGDIERLVEERIVSLLKDEGELHSALAERISQAHEIETLISGASSLAARWPRMPSVEKRQRLQGLIARITLNPEGLIGRVVSRVSHAAAVTSRSNWAKESSMCDPRLREARERATALSRRSGRGAPRYESIKANILQLGEFTRGRSSLLRAKRKRPLEARAEDRRRFHLGGKPP
jgi:hypothetical protein